MIRLGVNIDHVATLRQVRLAKYPDIVEAMHLCERGGAEQITVHLREDRRHIQEEDVVRLVDHSLLPINLEIAFTEDLIEKVEAWRPFSVTLVPERREEMTTESGLNLEVVKKKPFLLKRLLQTTRVVGFIDSDLAQVQLAKDLGLDGVEFHTGPYSHAYEKSLRGRDDEDLREELKKLTIASQKSLDLDLEIKAGHGLTVQNVGLLCTLPGLTEFNIGHSIVARSIALGLEGAVVEMKNAIISNIE